MRLSWRPAGASLLIVNGVLTDLQNFDLYSLVDTIRNEVSITDMLGQTKLQEQDISNLLALRPQVNPLAGSFTSMNMVQILQEPVLAWKAHLSGGLEESDLLAKTITAMRYE